MPILQAILMGFIQGLTEFLPVSSSGHLVLTSSLYKLFTGAELIHNNSQEAFFDIILHVGTLVAILVYFWTDIVDIIKKFITACKEKNFNSNEAKLPLFIALSTIFTLIVVLPIKDIVEKMLVAPIFTGIFLLITSIVLYSSEWISKKFEHKESNITIKRAILIGLAQGCAIFPGLSRSGMTIATGLATGLDRVSCAKYSFLLSVPIIAAASLLYPLIDIDYKELATFDWASIFIGFVVSAVIGYLCIKYFIKFLSKFSMNIFAYYCFFVGLAMIIGFKYFA